MPDPTKPTPEEQPPQPLTDPTVPPMKDPPGTQPDPVQPPPADPPGKPLHDPDPAPAKDPAGPVTGDAEWCPGAETTGCRAA
jgi:hypothetical protein